LFLNGSGELPCLPLFGIDGYDSTEHSIPPVSNCLVRKRLCFDGFAGQLPKNGASEKYSSLLKTRHYTHNLLRKLPGEALRS
jgi:hypothetical protein